MRTKSSYRGDMRRRSFDISLVGLIRETSDKVYCIQRFYSFFHGIMYMNVYDEHVLYKRIFLRNSYIHLYKHIRLHLQCSVGDAQCSFKSISFLLISEIFSLRIIKKLIFSTANLDIITHMVRQSESKDYGYENKVSSAFLYRYKCLFSVVLQICSNFYSSSYEKCRFYCSKCLHFFSLIPGLTYLLYSTWNMHL